MKKNVSIRCPFSWKVNDKIVDYLAPDEVYLPIVKEAKMLTKNKNVYKGDAIYEYHQKTYYSPVSGKIEKIIPKGNQYFLKICNDFRENDHYKGIDHTTVMITNDVKARIKNYHHHFFEPLKSCDTLILFGIEKEPFLAHKTFLHRYHMDEILLFLDTLATYYSVSQIILYFSENDQESIEAAEQIKNIYPKMKMILLPDSIPYGNKSYFQKTFHPKASEFILSSEEVFDAFYEIIKLRTKDFLYLTISGDAIKEPKVVRVKIGSVLENVLAECVSFLTDDVTLLKDGLISGTVISKDFILTDDVQAIFVMKTKDVQEEKCILCGKCNAVCPLGCNPYQMVQSKGLWKDKRCISCGLCSYVCPSHIAILKEGEED